MTFIFHYHPITIYTETGICQHRQPSPPNPPPSPPTSPRMEKTYKGAVITYYCRHADMGGQNISRILDLGDKKNSYIGGGYRFFFFLKFLPLSLSFFIYI